MIEYLDDEYFEMLGEPKPEKNFSGLDAYRFRVVLGQLLPGSVLDVGAYLGDFLKLARQRGHEIAGTDVNEARQSLANSLIGEDAVVVDFRNGRLSTFAPDSFDNVVCTEVLEHVPDHKTGLLELCRVARKRVIVTVPFKEQISQVLCVHCNRFAPHAGHLHSYDQGVFREICPEDWTVAVEKPFARVIARRIGVRLPQMALSVAMLRFMELIPLGSAGWLLVILDKR